MSKLSVVILKQNKRADNTYPIQIRVFAKGKYIVFNSEMSAHEWEVESKWGDKSASVLSIKDRQLFRRVDNLVRKYEDILETIDTTGLTLQEIKKRIVFELAKSKQSSAGVDFINYLEVLITDLKENNRTGSAANMITLRNSLTDYIERPMLFNYEITTKWLNKYSAWLQKKRIMERNNHGKKVKYVMEGLSETSLYNRLKDLRTAYNCMIKEYNNEALGEIVIKNYPFREFKLSQPESLPRGLSAKELIPLYKLYDRYDMLLGRERMTLDLFFLSFFLIGINAVDLHSAPREALIDDRLIYNRSKVKGKRKDKARTPVKIEPEANDILKKYLSADGPQLLTLASKYKKREYLSKALSIGMRALCSYAEIPNVNFYAARHSWATIARNECNISKDDINLALNHKEQNKALRITDIYIKPDYTRIDQANRKVIDHFFAELQSSLRKASPPPLSEATGPQSPKEKQ